MQRVPWERHGGDDVEAVVAMMVNREHPNSTRITPSKGDGGIDILDRSAAPDGGDLVYQVKRYTAPLNATQKGEVENSLARLLGKERDPRWGRLNVTQWRLVLPWDPTPEALTWLEGLGAKYEVEAVWDGLATVDGWCASYPEVVDYYLGGGSQRIQEAFSQAMAFTSLNGQATKGLDIQALAARVQESLQGPLSQDPHYRYGFRFGEGEPPFLTEANGLVMSETRVGKDGWFAIDVYARCAASRDARPIVLDGKFSAVSGTPQADALRRFIEYGEISEEPFQLAGELDAPGGLSATLTEATAQILPAKSLVPDEDDELRLEVLDVAGEVLATCHADRLNTGSGTKGISFIILDVKGVFDLMGRADLRTSQTEKDSDATGDAIVEQPKLTLNLKLEKLYGAPVMTVSDSASFLAQLHEPNQLRVGSRHLPARHGATQQLTGDKLPQLLVKITDAVHALSTIQDHTKQVVRVPDLAEFEHQIPAWVRIARLLKGEPVSSRYPEGQALFLKVAEDYTASTDESLRVLMPLNVQVGMDTLHLGQVVVELTTPELHSQTVQPGGKIMLCITTPDRVVRWTFYDPSTEADDSPK